MRKRDVAPPAFDALSLLWPRAMDTPTAAKYIGSTVWAVEVLCRTGQVVAYKDKAWRIDRFELDKYVSRRTAEAATRGDREKADT
jgi:hypothetical protein